MVNIDVSAEFNGYIADMGESFVLAPADPARTRICRAVRHAVTEALRRVRAGRSLNVIGHTVQRVADRYGYRIVGNLASHGVGRTPARRTELRAVATIRANAACCDAAWC